MRLAYSLQVCTEFRSIKFRFYQQSNDVNTIWSNRMTAEQAKFVTGNVVVLQRGCQTS